MWQRQQDVHVCQNLSRVFHVSGLLLRFGEAGSTRNEDSDKQKKYYSSILIVF